jgi:glycosyltransferase involved in cell wall biosynthesis
MFIKNSDYLISSSHYEGFPRVVNEALAIGTLCIGTNVTGTREALNYGKRGILVDDSPEGLASGMLDVINNKRVKEKYRDEINLFDGNRKTFFSKFEELTRKKSMCIYMPKLSCGGMEKALVNLINMASLNDKYKLTLYLLYSGENNYLELLPKNIELKILYHGNANNIDKIKIGFKLILRYIKMLFNEYDIAISYAHQHMLLTNLTLISSKNTILYIHSNIRETYGKKTKQKCRTCNYKNFGKIVCVSQNSKIAITEEINRHENLYFINNVIDGQDVISKSKEAIDDFKFESNKINIVNISRLTEEPKALSRIIKSTDRLNKEFSDFNIILIGDGPDYETYKKMIDELKLENVFMLGYKENPYKYLAEADALVLSSTREGYPVVFVESMILNTPIITTDLSDAKNDINDKYGYVNENSEDGVYRGIKKFLELRFEIKNKFNYVEFNEEIVNKIIDVFEEEKNDESDIYK